MYYCIKLVVLTRHMHSRRRSRTRSPDRDSIIKNLIIVEGHGVTTTTRSNPHASSNQVEVVYPTIMTANLGRLTNICGYMDQLSDQICSIVTNHIYDKSKDPEHVFEPGIPLTELKTVLENQAVRKTHHGLSTPYAIFDVGTPIKIKLPGEKVQNIELFCPGVRNQHNMDSSPRGNPDGVYVCNLTNFKNTNATREMFEEVLRYDEKDSESMPPKVSRYMVFPRIDRHGQRRRAIKYYSWKNFDGSTVTYHDVATKLIDKYDPNNTAIMLLTCRGFEDDGSSDDKDTVPSTSSSQFSDLGFISDGFDGGRRINHKRYKMNKKSSVKRKRPTQRKYRKTRKLKKCIIKYKV